MPGEIAAAAVVLQPLLDGVRATALQVLAQIDLLQAQFDTARTLADLARQEAEAATLPPAPAPAPTPTPAPAPAPRPTSNEAKKADPAPAPAAAPPSRPPPPLPPPIPMQPPGRGETFYAAYRKAKGGRTRTGAVMGLWAEMSADFKRAYTAAGEMAAQGKTPAECYGTYLAARNGTAFDGLPAPAWTGLQDQDAWTAAADALRLG